MPTADLPIYALDIRVVDGQARQPVTLVGLVDAFPEVTTWTMVAGDTRATLSGAVAVDGDDVVITLTAGHTSGLVGEEWRLRGDGVDIFGGRIRAATPTGNPEASTVTVTPSSGPDVDITVNAIGTTVTADELGDIGDVNVTGATDGQVLSFDGTDWVPAAPGAGDLAGLTDVDVPTPADGELLAYESTGGLWVAISELPSSMVAVPTGGDPATIDLTTALTAVSDAAAAAYARQEWNETYTDVEVDPFTAAYQGVRSTIGYGTGLADAVGTVNAFNFGIEVIGSANAESEFGGMVGAVRMAAGQTGSAWPLDIGAHTASDGTVSGVLSVATLFANQHHAASPSRVPSYNTALVTLPGAGPGTSVAHQAANTYALDYGLIVVGRSTEGPGYNVGIKVGGIGTPWMEDDVTGSQVGTGVEVADWLERGIVIRPPHGSATGDAALAVTDGADATLLSLNADGTINAADGTAADEVATLGQVVGAIDTLDELADGVGTRLDTATAGFVGIDRVVHATSNNTVTSTTAETSILSSTIDFPANTFSSGGEWITGDFFLAITNNTGSNRDVTIRIKMDGVTIYTVTLTAIGTNATLRPLSLRFGWGFGTFIGVNPFGGCEYVLGAPGGGAAAQHGVITATLAGHTLSNPLSFDITAQLSFNSASLAAQLAAGTVKVSKIAAP